MQVRLIIIIFQPAHAHIKGGGRAQIQSTMAGTFKTKNSQARMPEPFACAIARLRRTTVSYIFQHMLTTRGIYIRIRYCAIAMAGYGSVSDLVGSAFADQMPFSNTRSL